MKQKIKQKYKGRKPKLEDFQTILKEAFVHLRKRQQKMRWEKNSFFVRMNEWIKKECTLFGSSYQSTEVYSTSIWNLIFIPFTSKKRIFKKLLLYFVTCFFYTFSGWKTCDIKNSPGLVKKYSSPVYWYLN